MKAKIMRAKFFVNKLFFLGLVSHLLFITVAKAEETMHPNILISAEEIAVIKTKFSVDENGVVTGQEPWKSAYAEVIKKADEALKLPMMSVTFGGENNNDAGCRGDSRIFCAGGFYENENRYDADEAVKVGVGVRDLGMAYAFSGDAKYAEHLIKLVRVWAINPTTSLRPLFVTNGARISLFSNQGGVIYGAGLAWDYPGWEQSDRDAFKVWVQAFGEAVKDLSPANNNFENWRNALLSIAGAFTGDQDLLNASFQNFRNAIPGHIHWTGRMDWEWRRTQGWGGLGYSVYAITAMTITAEVARLHNVDLYNYTSDGIRGLRVALDFLAPYIADPSLWGKDKASKTAGIGDLLPYRNRGAGVYEVAYSIWEDPDHLAVINRWGRPLVMAHWAPGVITLTHGNRFDLDVTPTPPRITRQPENLTVTEGEDAHFKVVATGSATLTYQWFRNGSALEGETNASYTVESASAADNGDMYRCEVSNSVLADVSCGESVMLSVEQDTTAPVLESALAINDSRVDLIFSEAVSVNSAEDTGNYQMDQGIVVESASLQGDVRTVSLTVSQLTEDTTYTVQVNHLQDLAPTPNTMASTSKTFTYRIADDFEDNNADGWIPLNGDRWEVTEEDDGNHAYYLNTTEFAATTGKALGEYSLLSPAYADFTFSARAKLGDPVGDNGYADYAVVFGFENENNYYYVIFNNDQSSTQLYKVVNGDRGEALATAEADWLNDNDYHTIKITRAGDVTDVYFDDNSIMSATNTSGVGQVGVGSYNDSAYFDDVKVVVNATPTPDTTPPVITLVGADPQEIELGTAYTELGASASDNVAVDEEIEIDASAVDTTKLGSYLVTYNVKDVNDNAAIPVQRTVNVIPAKIPIEKDKVAPEIFLVGADPQEIELGTAYTELGASASDNIDDDTVLSSQIEIDASAVNTSLIGTYIVTYNVMDAAENAAVQMQRTVNVIPLEIPIEEDQTAPVITLEGSASLTLEVGNTYVELGASASDNVDGDLSVKIKIDASAVDSSLIGSYRVTYNVTDAAGNSATQVTRMVNVKVAPSAISFSALGGPLLGLGFMLLAFRLRRQA